MDAGFLGVVFRMFPYLKKIGTKAKGKRSGRQVRKAEEKTTKVGALARSAAAISYLEWKYSEYAQNLLRVGSRVYPVLTFPAHRDQLTDPDCILGPEPREPFQSESTLISDTICRVTRERAGRPLVNDPTYTMLRLTCSPRLKLDCGMGTYYESLDTCECLEWELAEAVAKEPNPEEAISKASRLGQIDSRLRLRRKLHDTVESPVLDGTGRSVAIGGECAVAFMKEGTLKILIAARQALGVATHEGLFDVVPGYMFQPVMSQTEEFSIRFNVYRELAEEMYNVPTDQAGHPERLWRVPQIKRITEMEENRRAKLYLTGIGITPANLRPEVCTLLLITDERWYEEYVKERNLNIEFSNETREVDICSVSDYRVDRKRILDNAGGRLDPDRITAPGAAAFWLAVDLLDRLRLDPGIYRPQCN